MNNVRSISSYIYLSMAILSTLMTAVIITIVYFDPFVALSQNVKADVGVPLLNNSQSDVGYYSSLAIGADGLPIIAYYDISNVNLKVAKCGNASCSTGNFVKIVDAERGSGWYPSVAIGRDGKPVISYAIYDPGNVGNVRLRVIHCGDLSCGNENIITTVDNEMGSGYFSSIAIGGDGLPVVAYVNLKNDKFRVLKCGNTSCTSGNTTTNIDSEQYDGWLTSIAIAGDGLPIITHMNAAYNDLKVTKCGNPDCSSGNTTTGIDQEQNSGWYSSITIGNDGLPIISYGVLDKFFGPIEDASLPNMHLKVVKCGNTNCTEGNIVTKVDESREVGYFSSIKLGIDNLAIISYFDSSNKNLKVVKCGNIQCSDSNLITTVDNSIASGTYTSIGVGTDNLPVISYRDDTNNALKVAKCGNSTCSSNNQINTVDPAPTPSPTIPLSLLF